MLDLLIKEKNHLALVALRSNENAAPRDANPIKMIIGIGGLSSAIKGAKIDISFAPTVQKPKALPAKIAGKRNEFAK